jgi:hypothetical protein
MGASRAEAPEVIVAACAALKHRSSTVPHGLAVGLKLCPFRFSPELAERQRPDVAGPHGRARAPVPTRVVVLASCGAAEIRVTVFLSPLRGWFSLHVSTQGLRPGLHSAAAWRLCVASMSLMSTFRGTVWLRHGLFCDFIVGSNPVCDSVRTQGARELGDVVRVRERF